VSLKAIRREYVEWIYPNKKRV